MLVLSRSRNESIAIGEDIRVVVVEIRGDRVRLGIETPRECPVHREEVVTSLRAELQVDVPAERSARPPDIEVMLG